MANTVKTTFQFKRGLLMRWEEKNPILNAGEPGWASDVHILKIGDGVHPWTELPALTEVDLNEEDIQKAVERYFEKLNIDYDTILGFDTSEIVFGNTSTTSILGQAILGQMVLA